jgi:uncharacterized protein
MAGIIRILSIDGGGIRGIIAGAVLRELLGDQKASDVFHLISGTSTGGILACGLCAPQPFRPQDLIDLYVEHGAEIFELSVWRRIPGAELVEEKYSAAQLEHYLKHFLGESRLSDINGVDLLVPSYAIELPKPRAKMFFRSWQAKGEGLPADARKEEYDFFLRDVARATSAAPTYFEPADIRNMAGERLGMIDGGVFANNPSMCALAAAWRRYGEDYDYMVVSLGTGSLQRPIPLDEAKGWGKIGWARPILSVLMDGNSDTVSFQLDEVLGEDHHRFDIPLGVRSTDHHAASDDLDNASPENIRALLAKADDLIRNERAKIDELAHLLRSPRTKLAEDVRVG